MYIKQNTHKRQTQSFWRISPFGIALVRKAHKARARWYREPFRWFINTRFKTKTKQSKKTKTKKQKKEKKNGQKQYKYIKYYIKA